MAPTRAYPIPPLTPLIAMNRNAVSSVAELGVPAMTRFMELWRPRLLRYAAPLHRGLPRPVLSLDEYAEYALVSLAAELETCTAATDDALYAWVSSRTTDAVLELHAIMQAAARTRRRAAIATAA